ncbi:hypothetical protein [Microtetraspora malaysiensis]|uniref:hypothetical protein n=1 Tax=Microtetraspora malaysiensis TaxID=161358 RepID=UPI0012FBB5CE|nr:hypothetical protein [Microtetraspora malaysiensis]
MTKNKRKGFDDLIARRDELGDASPPWSLSEEEGPESAVEPSHGTDAGPAGPEAVPAPYETANIGELTVAERDDLAACESAIDTLRVAFWAAGKALQVIRDARLYRTTHPTFEAYVGERWEMTRTQADRLIRAWPLAERLTPIGVKIINEAQIRELLPLADQHGQDAAVTVYRTVAEAGGVRVTAALLKGVVAILPPDRFGHAEAVAQIRAYLAGEIAPPDSSPTTPAELWSVEAGRVRTALRRVRQGAVSAAVEHPDDARKLAAELRELADEVEQGLQ